jgi:thioester reductase-like protein
MLLLQIIGMAADVAAPLLKGKAADITKLTGAIDRIITAAAQAHLEATGQPIDLDKLKIIEPVV